MQNPKDKTDATPTATPAPAPAAAPAPQAAAPAPAAKGKAKAKAKPASKPGAQAPAAAAKSKPKAASKPGKAAGSKAPAKPGKKAPPAAKPVAPGLLGQVLGNRLGTKQAATLQYLIDHKKEKLERDKIVKHVYGKVTPETVGNFVTGLTGLAGKFKAKKLPWQIVRERTENGVVVVLEPK